MATTEVVCSILPSNSSSKTSDVAGLRLLVTRHRDVVDYDIRCPPLRTWTLSSVVECERLLIENRTCVHKTWTNDGTTSLIVATTNNHDICVPLLIKDRACFDVASTNNGSTPLLDSSSTSHVNVPASDQEPRRCGQSEGRLGATALFMESANGTLTAHGC